MTDSRDSDGNPLADALRAAGWQVQSTDSGLRATGTGRAADVNRAATAAGITLARLGEAQDSLEELFLEMTGRTDGELAAGRATGRREAD